MSAWDPEIEVGAALARRLIGAQFPQVDCSELELLGEGWDYTIWTTVDRVAFRFPRREVVLPGMRREMELLPFLSERLPAAIPDARHRGAPSPEFPWPFFGSRLIAGRELTEAQIPATARAPLARELGAFLRDLHALPAPEPLRTVVDPNRRADMGFRVPRTRELIARISDHWPAAAEAERILDAAEQLLPDRRLVLSHGDLHLRQILVTDGGRLSGIVDWVDLCVAPASVDLSVLWSLFLPQQRALFLDTYGPVDLDTLTRARALALCLSAMLAAYALDRGNGLLLRETLAELDRAVIE